MSQTSVERAHPHAPDTPDRPGNQTMAGDRGKPPAESLPAAPRQDSPPPRGAEHAATPLPAEIQGLTVQGLTVYTRVSAGEMARATLAVMGVVLGVYLLWRIQDVLLLFLLAIILATAIDPLVNRLRRGPFTRGSGVLVVYGAILLAIAIPSYAFGPSLVNQGAAFTETLPNRIAALRPTVSDSLPRLLREPVLNAIDRASAAARNPAAPAEEQLVEVGSTAVHSLIGFITVFVLAFYWMVERASFKRALLRLVSPANAREVNTLWLEMEIKLGGWVRGQLLLMLSIGVMAGIGFAVLGLPSPFLLAVLAAIGEMVPLVGPFLAFAPALLVALAIDPAKAVSVLIFAVVIQQVESHVLVPRVMGHTVGVSPLTVLLGILAGSVLYGLPGAFLAVPVAGAVQVILAHSLRVEDPSQSETHDQIMTASGAERGAPAAQTK